MSDALSRAARFQDLLSAGDDAGPYVYASLFPAESRRDRRRSKRRFTLLRRLDPALRPMLDDGERVIFLTAGSVTTFWGQLFGGWLTYAVNRRAIVATNRRVLLLQIGSRGTPRVLRAEIGYGAVAEIKTGLLSNVQLRFRDGERRLIAGMPPADRKDLREIVTRLAGVAPAAARDGLQDLCPHCFAPADVDPLVCPTCQGRFKSPRVATLLSLLFPGMGDLYIGHRGVAILELAVAGLVWLSLLAVAFDPAVPPLAFVVTLGLFVVAGHGGDAVATRQLAHAGLYPAGSHEHPGRRFVFAALVPVAVIAAAAGPVTARRGLTPSPGLVDGAALPQRHVTALRSAGYVAPDEEITLFFSGAEGTILEHGTLLTDRRVVLYTSQGPEHFVLALPYDSIVDLWLEESEESPALSALRIMPDDGMGFYVLLPTAAAQDSAFLHALGERWRAIRPARGALWYDGGPGFAAADPIEVRGPLGADGLEGAERQWLRIWFGDDWEMVGRFTRQDGDRLVDEVAVRFATGVEQHFYFDATGGG